MSSTRVAAPGSWAPVGKNGAPVRLNGSPRQRRVPYLLVGILLVLGCAAGGVVVALRLGHRVPVLELARPGHRLDKDHAYPPRLRPEEPAAACPVRTPDAGQLEQRPPELLLYPSEYAIANKLDHPLTVYVREDAILEPLDTWLAGAFSPQVLEDSIARLEASQPEVDVQAETARRALEEAGRKLGRHRAALEAGADPMLVAQWSREVQAERAIAEARLATLGAG